MISDAAQRLRSTLDAWIPRGADVALVDVPVHRNAGDLFILAVAMRWLEERQCRIVYRTGVRDWRVSHARRCIGSDTVLVGLGGGNFGDLYPRYQALRERIAAAFPIHRFVILPQTVYFADAGTEARALRALARHRDLRIAVRDVASEETARRCTAHVALLPDLVHGLGWSDSRVLSIRESREGTTLRLMRRDSERTTGRPSPAGSLDWPDILPGLRTRLAATAAAMAAAPAPWAPRVHHWWAAYARTVLDRALARVSSADRVITDRLHGAILARLAGRPVTLHDNAHGKLSAYYQTWWRDDPDVELVNAP